MEETQSHSHTEHEHPIQTTQANPLEEKSFIKKIQFPKIAKAIILSSVATVLVVLILLGGLLWINRASLVTFLATEYVKSTSMIGESPINSKTGLPVEGGNLFTQESYVVDAVKKANPAVVSIIITKDVPKYETYYDNQNPFSDIFGDIFNIPQQRQNGTEKKEVGGGSGFLVTSNGLIVTNRHVVDDKTAEYTVFTNDGKKHDAKVVARDSVLDIAIIKIDGSDYTSLEFGDSDRLQVGQSVIAIGNALGEFKNTVSVGVVSGLSRSVTAGDGTGQSEFLDKVIQTDAAINPGNSGGPLLNLSGKVIGVNVAVAQGSQSIGFALPINSIKSVVESVKTTGKIVRPYIGIRYVAITPELKEKNNLSVDYGILVSKGATSSDLAVIPGSPANKAGIVENDIVLELDGKKLDEDQDFAQLIRQKQVGDTVTLKILSKGNEKTVQVKLETAPETN